MMQAWYIDSIDPYAGRAFASWRCIEIMMTPTTNEFGRSIFVSPPSFQPEFIDDATIALAATRGSFQIGVMDAEGEIPFPTAASVAEFVRRSYLSGGGREDTGGDGPPDLPGGEPTEGGSGQLYDIELDTVYEREERISESRISRAMAALSANLEWLEKPELRLDRGIAQEFRFFSSNGESVTREEALSASDRIGRAAVVLLIELFQRLPAKHKSEEWNRWATSFLDLAALIQRLGLASWLLFDPFGMRLRKNLYSNIADILRRNKVDHQGAWRWWSASLPRDMWIALFVKDDKLDELKDSRYPDDLYFAWRHLGYKFPYFAWHSFGLDYNRSFLSASDFQRIPMPSWLCDGLNFGPLSKGRPSLMNFLSIACAEPVKALTHRDRTIALARQEMLLLSAVGIVSDSSSASRRPAIGFDFSMHGHHLDDALSFYHSNLLAEAIDWLDHNLPQYVFSRSVEDVIGDTRSLEYA